MAGYSFCAGSGDARQRGADYRARRGTHFFCFTGTKAQTPTQMLQQLLIKGEGISAAQRET
jgi:hypothetical protein